LWPVVHRNPDLRTRFAAGASLVDVDWPTVYGPDAAGYTNYPTMKLVEY
jgi:hypothetical protein